MEYCQGDLSSLIRKGRIREEQAIEMIKQICKGY